MYGLLQHLYVTPRHLHLILSHGNMTMKRENKKKAAHTKNRYKNAIFYFVLRVFIIPEAFVITP